MRNTARLFVVMLSRDDQAGFRQALRQEGLPPMAAKRKFENQIAPPSEGSILRKRVARLDLIRLIRRGRDADAECQ
eukprot:COSAG06_NODE_677_length_13149_cov_37.657854_8_plen_76_part_00